MFSPCSRAARTRQTHSEGPNMTPSVYIQPTCDAGRGLGNPPCRKSGAERLLPFWKCTCKLSTCAPVLPILQGVLNYRMHKTPKKTTLWPALSNSQTSVLQSQNHISIMSIIQTFSARLPQLRASAPASWTGLRRSFATADEDKVRIVLTS
jgi:hypothetical protein